MRLVTSSGSPSHNQHLNLRRVIELPRLQLVCARVKDSLVGVAIGRDPDYFATCFMASSPAWCGAFLRTAPSAALFQKCGSSLGLVGIRIGEFLPSGADPARRAVRAMLGRWPKMQSFRIQAFLISIFCCFVATSAGFGKWMCNTPLSNFASTFAGSGSNGSGIARLNEP
jgi:hypothetical protein